MIDPTDPRNNPLLRAVVDATIAWQSPAQLATKLGLDLDAACDAIADLDAAGWLDPWEIGATLYVTLTPRAAGLLGVRLVPVGLSEAMRWAGLDEPDSPTRAAGRPHEGVSALALAADPGPGPEASAEASERAERLAKVHAGSTDLAWLDNLPRPTTLLGVGLTPWPGPRRDPADVCPGCRSRAISGSTYCLVCDRWGLDHLLAAAPGRTLEPGRAPRRKRSAPNTPADFQAQALAAKAARKAKHRQKLAAMEAKLKADRAALKGKTKPIAPPSTRRRQPSA